jgi:hypothetical protein
MDSQPQNPTEMAIVIAALVVLPYLSHVAFDVEPEVAGKNKP